MANISWKSLGHALLNGLGMIPGIGDAFDLINATWYLADGDYKNALLSGISALPFVGDIIGTGIDIMGAAKAARFVKTATRAVSYAATFTQATGGAVRGMKDVWKNVKDGKFFTKQNAIDMAGVAINTFTAICSGKSAYKYGSETVGIMKTTVSDVWSGIKKQATALHNNNGGYLNLGGNESGGNINQTLLSGEEWYRYFQDTYGADNVNWNVSSFDDMLNHPTSLRGYSADEIGEILGYGWTRKTYGSNGSGWKFIEDAHQDNMIFYHGGGGKAHSGAYYGVSTGGKNGGRIKMVDVNTYYPTPDDDAIIIYNKDW